MIILLPVLLVLALVTLWLRAVPAASWKSRRRASRVDLHGHGGDENSEFEQLMTVGIADDEPSMACRISTSRK